MLHVRLVVPAGLRAAVLDRLRTDETICNVCCMIGTVEIGATCRPAADLVECDIPAETANNFITDLKSIGVHHEGSITMLRVDTVVSERAAHAEDLAPGEEAEAVIWEDVESRVGQEARLTVTFVALMVVAVCLAAVAVLIDSQILVVGAMVVGPDFGPVAAVTVGLHRRHRHVPATATATLAGGFAAAIAAAAVMTLILRSAGQIPGPYLSGEASDTQFIANPDLFTVLVALLAGVAGMLSVTQGRSGIIVGVLISVTTIPAAGNIGVALAMGRWTDVGGSALQLAMNLCCLVVAGLVTLAVQQRLLTADQDAPGASVRRPPPTR